MPIAYGNLFLNVATGFWCSNKERAQSTTELNLQLRNVCFVNPQTLLTKLRHCFSNQLLEKVF